MKTLFGSIIVDGVNKIGGHVVQSNHYGRFMRTRVTPANPQTDRQVAVREQFLEVKAAWLGLSAEVVLEWAAVTGDFPRQNQFGETYYPTASNLFQWLNTNLLSIGEAIVLSPPSPEIPAPDLRAGLFVSEDSEELTLTWEVLNDEPDMELLLFATTNLNVGVNYVSTALKLIGHYPLDNSPTLSFNLDYETIFPDAPTVLDKKIFVRVQAVSKNSGQKSVDWTYSTIVV